MASDAHIRGSDSTVQQGTVRYGDRTLLSIIGVVFVVRLRHSENEFGIFGV